MCDLCLIGDDDDHHHCHRHHDRSRAGRPWTSTSLAQPPPRHFGYAILIPRHIGSLVMVSFQQSET
jgi:hypothetical protein